MFARKASDAETVQTEYRAAKNRYRAKLRAERDWDQKVGLTELRKKCDDNRRETRAAWKALGNVPLKSVKDAVAITGLLREQVKKYGELTERWELAAFLNASRYLTREAA